MRITIDIQCANIELASPVHFIKGATYHVQFPQQMNSKRIMEAYFITGISEDTFGGALLYHLQVKGDTSISTQLLVIWGQKHDKIYSYVWLIEHENTFAWDKDKLERLYNVYYSRYDIDFNTERWLLNDNTILETVNEISHGGFKMKVIIREHKSTFYARRLPWFDSNR
jgi:hypothetical protein